MRIRLLAFACALLAAGAARATVLDTTALYAPTGYSPSCTETNLGKDTLEVTISILGLDGAEIDSATFQTLPGYSTGLGSGTNFTGYARCRFEFKGSRKNVRALLSIDNNTTGLSQTAVPAQ